MFELVAPKVGGALAADGTQVTADHMILGAPSVIFDAVVVAPGAAAMTTLLLDAAAKQWVADAYAHCKVIGVVGAAQPLLDAAGVKPDAGLVDVKTQGVDAFVTMAKEGRIWAREVLTLGPDKREATSAVPSRQTPAVGKAAKPAAKKASAASKPMRRR
jgi:catalase